MKLRKVKPIKRLRRWVKRRGFTIVELIVGIVVIAILAAIGITAYNGVQRKAAEAAVLSDIRQIAQRIIMASVVSGQIPTNIDEIVATSPGVQVAFVTSGASTSLYYSNLTDSQNGLLFFNHCQDLVTEGLGSGPNDFGANTVAYISGCHVYGNNYMQINGWNGGFNISSPSVTKEMLNGYVNTAASSHPAHPSYRATLQGFMDELMLRFEREGGKFPIVRFWEPWIGMPTLPPPDTVTGGVNGYCVIATHVKHNGVSYVSTYETPTPRAGASCD